MAKLLEILSDSTAAWTRRPPATDDDIKALALKQATPRMKSREKMSAAAGPGEHVAGFMNS
jgi:hypothetical protein